MSLYSTGSKMENIKGLYFPSKVTSYEFYLFLFLLKGHFTGRNNLFKSGCIALELNLSLAGL